VNAGQLWDVVLQLTTAEFDFREIFLVLQMNVLFYCFNLLSLL
jgi:hypothetical protein